MKVRYEIAPRLAVHTSLKHFIQNPENRLVRFSGFFYFVSLTIRYNVKIMKPQLLLLTLLTLAGVGCTPTPVELKMVKPSEMKLPMVWNDTIYDTCFTWHSFGGRYTVFVGCTEEDKMLNEPCITEYGLLSVDERNSIFLYDTLEKTTTLLKTSSPEGGGIYSPQLDVNNGWVYYFRQNYVVAGDVMRYDLRTNEEAFLTHCSNYTWFTLLPSGSILFQDVRDDVMACYPSDSIDWQGFVLYDMEMSPAGVCVMKSEAKYEGLPDAWFLNDKSVRQLWNDSLQERQYFNSKGELVGYTSNYIESYDGWYGLKQQNKE